MAILSAKEIIVLELVTQNALNVECTKALLFSVVTKLTIFAINANAIKGSVHNDFKSNDCLSYLQQGN
jgi:hypothetical protein